MNEQRRLAWITTVGGILVLAALVLSLCIPNFIRSGPSKTVGIANNLRQLDGAKQQWAFEHGSTGAVMVTEEDVAPYLRSFKPVAGERYVLKTLPEPPEAELTRDLEGKRKGSVLRLNNKGTLDVILPNTSAKGMKDDSRTK